MKKMFSIISEFFSTLAICYICAFRKKQRMQSIRNKLMPKLDRELNLEGNDDENEQTNK